MDVRQLRNFVIVAQEQNFGRAADRIALSQPALSRQIQALEEEIGLLLFDRSAKTIRLTPAGRTYEVEVRRIIGDLDSSARLAREVAAGRAGHLRIGFFGSAILDFIPEAISRFAKASPKVRIDLQLMDKDLQIEALRSGQLDIGFNRLVPDEPDIVVERVRSEPLVFATRHDNVLAHQAQVEVEAIFNEPLILYPAGVRNSLMHHIRDIFARYGHEPIVAQEVPDPTTALALIAAGMGSALMPRAVSRLQLPDVRFLPFTAGGQVRVNLAILYPLDRRSPAFEVMLDIIRQLAREQQE